MSEKLETVRVKPWGKGQGDFVEINKADFDKAPKGVYELFEMKVPKPQPAAVKTDPVNDGLSWDSKATRDAAVESGLDFSKVVGTGKKKAITMKDVEAAIEAAKPKANFASDEAGELFAEVGLTSDDLAKITGTGENGAVTVEDITKYVDTLTNE